MATTPTVGADAPRGPDAPHDNKRIGNSRLGPVVPNLFIKPIAALATSQRSHFQPVLQRRRADDARLVAQGRRGNHRDGALALAEAVVGHVFPHGS